jgi:hypothetical protein
MTRMPETELQSGTPPLPGKKTRSTRRKILAFFAGIVVLLLVVILTAPTFLSTGSGLSFLLSQVNSRLNGKVEAQSVSLGWFTGVELTGLRVKDAKGTQIAGLDHLTMPFPLWRVITGTFPLGQVSVDGLSFDARTNAQGQLNFADLVKKSDSSSDASDSGKKSSSSKPLQLWGDIKLAHCRGTYTEYGLPPVYLRTLDAEVKIPQTATPIDDATISINALSAALKDDGVMKVSVNNASLGGLLSNRKTVLPVTIDYDLAAIWPLVQPRLGDKYKSLKITGKFTKQFNISGSYPADKPFAEAIKSLHVDGDLEVLMFDYDGLNLQKLILPLTLDNGKLTTVYANKPAGSNTAPPAIANSGSFDAGDFVVDLTQDPPTLTTPDNHPFITQCSVNPLFANTILAKFLNNPVFMGSDASGFFTCSVIDCRNIPLGAIVRQNAPANVGTAHLKYSLAPLVIGVQGVGGLESLIRGKLFTASVRDGSVAISRGTASQHVTFAAGKYTLEFDGNVRLADEALQQMKGTIAGRVSFPVEGTLTHASVPLEKVAKGALTDLQKNLFGGSSNGDGNNPLGGLLDKLQNKKK